MEALTVSQVNNLIHSTLNHEELLQQILIKGTITNLKRHSSGHYYFSLKDEKCSIDVALFKNIAIKKLSLVKELENGLLITIMGSVNFYEPWGQLNVICQDLIIETKSPLQIEFERLKNELAALGYFSDSHKQALPYMAKCIGMVTSQSGAVLHDILNVARQRNPLIKFKLFAVPVQGTQAGAIIAEGIKMANADKDVDLIIVGRGGGSMEDLWCFNDRKVVEALYQCTKPTISAVGHETDYTLCDFAADVRSSTPSHAAELAVRTITELFYEINLKKEFLDKKIVNTIQYEKQKVMTLFSKNLVYPIMQFVKNQSKALQAIEGILINKWQHQFQHKTNKLALLEQKLLLLNPVKLMEKGYTKIDIENKVIVSAHALHVGDKINIVFSDGSIKATVEEVNE